jgi:hypothetical protein
MDTIDDMDDDFVVKDTTRVECSNTQKTKRRKMRLMRALCGHSGLRINCVGCVIVTCFVAFESRDDILREIMIVLKAVVCPKCGICVHQKLYITARKLTDKIC